MNRVVFSYLMWLDSGTSQQFEQICAERYTTWSNTRWMGKHIMTYSMHSGGGGCLSIFAVESQGWLAYSWHLFIGVPERHCIRPLVGALTSIGLIPLGNDRRGNDRSIENQFTFELSLDAHPLIRIFQSSSLADYMQLTYRACRSFLIENLARSLRHLRHVPSFFPQLRPGLVTFLQSSTGTCSVLVPLILNEIMVR